MRKNSTTYIVKKYDVIMNIFFFSEEGTAATTSENESESQSETVIYTYPKVMCDFTIS